MRKAEADTLAQFHREFRPALMAFFLRRSQSHSEAEDLTQEVFIRIASKSDVSMRSAEAYVFQVAANLLRDRGRRAKVRQDYAAGMRTVEGLGVEQLDPYRVAAGREQLACLDAALADLPERTRQVFLLFRFENVSQRAIADGFGISISAVEKHLSRAMTHLIQELGAEE